MGSRGSGDEGAGGNFNNSGKGVEIGGVELQERVEDYDPNRDLIRTEQYSKDTGLSARSDMGLLGP